jgi:hypothetical protein
MDQALKEIQKIYPDITSVDDHSDFLRVVDKSIKQDLLQLRTKEFSAREVRDPNVAVSALWHNPQVSNFASANHIRFLLVLRGGALPERAAKPISIHLQDASVAEILDKITLEFKSQHGSVWEGFWSYQECQSSDERIVQIRVF